MPTMRDPSLLVYFRPESGGLIMGGYERHRAPWSLDGIPADFNGKLLEEDWPRFEELMENAIVRVPSLEETEVVRLINGPEAFTPDGEFILGPTDVRGLLGRRRLLRARARRRGRDGAARRRVDRRGHAVARRLAHGLAPVRRRLPLARVHARPHEGGLRDLLRRQVPGARAPGRAAAAGLADVRAPAASSARRSARSPAGSGRTGSSRTRRAATSRCGRAAGRGSSGRRRSAPSTAPAARRRRCSTRRRSRRSRSRARRGRLPRAAVRQPRRPRGRAASPTRRC